MIFTKQPFDITYCHKEVEKDPSDHLFTLIYSFKSSDTKLRYILRAEYHRENVFAIKFYVKNHKESDYKYHLITNRGYPIRIFLTCAELVPMLLNKYPNTSFGLIGSRTIDTKEGIVEDIEENRRFKIYSEVILKKFGTKIFEHYDYPRISGYLMVNKRNANINSKRKRIEQMFYDNYRDIHHVEA